MKFPKITKFLPLALALAMTTSVAMAEDPVVVTSSDTGQAIYQLTVSPFYEVNTTSPAAAVATTPSAHYSVLTTQDDLTGSFEVVSNTDTKDIYLYAKCQLNGAGDYVPALGGAIDGEGAVLRLVFTNFSNTDALTHATSTQVEAVRKGTMAETADSPNAFALPLVVTTATVEGPEDVTGPVSAEMEDNQIHYVVNNGHTTFTCTVPTGSETLPDTFSTVDTDGTYQATLYVSSAEI